MKTQNDLSQFCIYTMRHSKDLAKAYQEGTPQEFCENKKWTTGMRLFLEAQRHDLKMPILFAAADVTSGLIYYAILDELSIDESNLEKPLTRYRFSGLTPIEGNPPLSALTLKNTNKRLSGNYIRPYAICYTPAFILGD